MHLTWKDGVATVLVAAVVVPFVGYMATGSMPYVQDPTGMAGLGLVLALIAAAIGGWIATGAGTVLRYATAGIGLASLAVGILALVSENFLDLATRQGLLIAFVAGVVLLWAISLLRHGGGRLIGTAPRSGAIRA